MSTKFEPLSEKSGFEIRSSRWFTVFILTIYFFAFVCLLLLNAFIWKLILAPLLGLHGYWTFTQKCLLHSPKALIHCYPIAENLWRITSREGKHYTAKIERSFYSSWLIILLFKTIPLRKTLTLVIPLGAIPKEDYKQLLFKRWKE